MAVPNQKLLLIDRTSTPSSGFFHFEHDIYFLANARLTLNGIRTFMYFMTLVPDSIDGKPNEANKRHGFYELSTSHIAKITHSTTRDAQRGIENLIKEGYLIQRKDNLYQFIDVLPEDKIKTVEEHQQVLNYKSELMNSLNAISDDRTKQLKQIAAEDLEKQPKQREKYSWED